MRLSVPVFEPAPEPEDDPQKSSRGNTCRQDQPTILLPEHRIGVEELAIVDDLTCVSCSDSPNDDHSDRFDEPDDVEQSPHDVVQHTHQAGEEIPRDSRVSGKSNERHRILLKFGVACRISI